MISRASGILMHVSSLPGKYGIGAMGENALRFVDFLSDAGQRYWQVLPMGHTGFGDSPYQCFSAFAGNPFFIDLTELCADGLLKKSDVDAIDFGDSPDFIDYGKLYAGRYPLLYKAYMNVSGAVSSDFADFQRENSAWLPDYALFMAAKKLFGDVPLWEWPDKALRKREPEALKLMRERLSDQVGFYEFLQYLFYKQWNKIKKYANKKGVHIIGDLPIYTAPDSADVWVNPSLFKLKEDLSPAMVAGVPPDYYSATGQLWGNPVFCWDEHEKDGYGWWMRRLTHSLSMFDMVRLDHFRGFKRYWEVAAGSKDASFGRWRMGPGDKFFTLVNKTFGKQCFIAEDLGMITPDVKVMLRECGYPGMKVMAFAFDGEHDNNEHMPHMLAKKITAYTSTHDCLPVRAGIEVLLPKAKEQAFAYLGERNLSQLGRAAIRALWSSHADTVMTSMQDLLSLGEDAVMNRPSVSQGNWRWRVREDALNREMAASLYQITKIYGRLCPKAEEKADNVVATEKKASSHYTRAIADSDDAASGGRRR